MGQKKAAKPKTSAGQQQAATPAAQSPDPAAQAAPAVSVSTLHQLEQKKRHLSQQLKDVERQVRGCQAEGQAATRGPRHSLLCCLCMPFCTHLCT